ncbi:MAG: asparagine--tRNA ligase [Deltaproteobacteria bacterium]|jgi:asparaginyl-tRNA synthetase|nr:asparagine--tRNA ligase [Deltaproteobacteria bacterium]
MSKPRIKDLLASPGPVPGIAVSGWVRTRRDGKGVSFLEINDGSSLANLQVVVLAGSGLAGAVREAATGAAVEAEGDLLPSQGQGQAWELVARALRVIGPAGPDYPLQKKRHSDEYLREIAHLRPRTNKYGAIMRLRSEMAWAIHDFFRGRDFFYVHSPIITGSDCEGAGAVFRVTTLPEGQAGPVGEDFFGRWAGLTVSGQLEAELMAMALGRVYTFGPTFRAENSNTARHAAEFWMIEPEAAFFDLADDMALAEDMVRALVGHALDRCQKDLELFDRFVEKGLLARLGDLASGAYHRMPYSEAMDRLAKSGEKFEFEPHYGCDLASEHERYLCQSLGGPVTVHDYPRSIKPFYMRLSDDGKTVAAMDMLVPKVGELIGGSQREERLDVLEGRLAEQGLPKETYWWYVDTRRWGTAPHAGFGLGFDRFLMLLTGVNNIRDVQPFPRTPKNLEF